MEITTTLHFGITHLIIASAWCFGFWNLFNEDMIFHKVDKWARGESIGTSLGPVTIAKGHLPPWLYKPLMGCVTCMASIHGSVFFLVFVGLDWQIILFVVCLSGLNFLASQIVRE